MISHHGIIGSDLLPQRYSDRSVGYTFRCERCNVSRGTVVGQVVGKGWRRY